ncbi:catalase family protein [Phenylobacterium sp.]|jgi:hypothetical protein|uniref:catalase family protein n=1 Tax=Phenylobacterium sp. TaxID=1871053 RepID=UPI002F93A071
MDRHRPPHLVEPADLQAHLPSRIALYSADVERVGPDEPEMAERLAGAIRSLAERTEDRRGEAVRAVHAKTYAVLEGELEVEAGLPAPLAQGLFAQPHRYGVTLRLSSLSGDVLPDQASLPRGCALKVRGAPGPRIAGAPERDTQDFVLANSRTFNARNARLFLAAIQALTPATEQAFGIKTAASGLLRRLEGLLERHGVESPELKAIGGQPLVHPLGDTFFGQVPVRYGRHMAKLCLTPESAQRRAFRDAPLARGGDPDAVALALEDHFASQGAAWRLCVQLCTDPARMPVEDGVDAWDEEESPFLPVARLRVEPQALLGEAAARSLAFSPWNGLEAHRPLGELMRLRRAAYAWSREHRLGAGGAADGAR